MIESIKGTLNKKDPTLAIIDVGGVRIGINITSVSYTHLTLPTNREV